jgi:hypothetical protein
VRLVGTAVAACALGAAEVWMVHAIASRLLALPEPATALGRALLQRMALLAGELALMISTASAVTLAVPAVEGVEADPWWGSSAARRCAAEPGAPRASAGPPSSSSHLGFAQNPARSPPSSRPRA